MTYSVLQKAAYSNLRTDPFPHVVLDEALPKDLYEALEAEYPFEYRIDGYSGFSNNTRYQISAVDGLRGGRLSKLWKEFVAFHTSEAFLQEVWRVFGGAIQEMYPSLSSAMHVGVRFKDSAADLWMDCQPGINSPVKSPTSVKGPHIDHQNELYAGLLYVRHPDDQAEGGELIVHKETSDTTLFHGARFVDEKYVEEVARIAYAPNRLVFFLNSVHSIHGLAPRSLAPYTRRLVNIIGEVKGKPLFTIPTKKSFLAQVKHAFVRE